MASTGGHLSRLANSSKTSSKNEKNEMEGEEKEEGPTRQDYINMVGDEIFEAFTRKRDEALRAAAEVRKMMMLTRHSVRYIDSHERSLVNEFQRFLAFAEQQRQREARKAKLLGLKPRSAPANIFAVRPAGSFGLFTPPKRTPEQQKGRRATNNLYMKMQMERIQNLRVARTTKSFKGTPPLRAINLSSSIRSKPITPRGTTQFSAEFLQGEPPHFATLTSRGRPATVPAETRADIYRWMEDFFKEHVPDEGVVDSDGPRASSKDSQLRDEQMLDQLCSIASVTPTTYIAESPWFVRRKSVSQPTSQRGSKYDHLHAPPVKQPKREMRIDEELAAQLGARRMEKWGKKSSQPRIPSLGKRKRRPQTATISPRPPSRKIFQLEATDTTLNSTLLLQEAAVEEVGNVRYVCLANRGIASVSSQELASFTYLRCLDLAGNNVTLMSLAPLTALRKLNLLGNKQLELEIPEGSFRELEALDVSFNLLNESAMIALSLLPSLRDLNMNNNHLELIPPEATDTGAFVRLEKLSAAGNNLSSTCLVSLSKLPWLETLNLHKNHIKGIPDQIAFEMRAFSRLETLDLADNPITYHYNLFALEKLQKLRKVFLCDTPLSRSVTYDGSGKCSPRSVPILQAAMRAQRAGQYWYLVKPVKLPTEDLYSDKLQYAVRDDVPLGMSSDKKMKARLEKSRRVDEEVHKSMMRNAAAERRIHSGPISIVAQSPETTAAELFIAESQKVTLSKKTPRRQSEQEEVMNERMKKSSQSAPSPAEPYLSQAQAAVAAARKALGMSPHEEEEDKKRKPHHGMSMRKSKRGTSTSRSEGKKKEAGKRRETEKGKHT